MKSSSAFNQAVARRCSKSLRTVVLAALLAWLSVHAIQAQTIAAPELRAARLGDGSTLELSFQGWNPEGQPVWHDDQDQTWSPSDQELEWGAGIAIPRGAIVRLKDGSFITGQLRDLSADQLQLSTRWWPELNIPRNLVTSILLRPRWDFSARQRQERLLDRESANDRCWLEGNDWIDGQVLALLPALSERPRGSLPTGFSMEIDGRPSTVSWERVAGIRFANPSPVTLTPVRQRIRTWDGSQFAISRVQLTSAGTVFITASGLQLPPLPERQLRLDEIIGVSLYAADGTPWPTDAPIAGARVPINVDPAAKELGARPAWRRQSVQIGDDTRSDAIVIEATATIAWKHDESPGTLSMRLGVVDPAGPPAVVQLFQQQADGTWSKTPFWSQRIEPGDRVRPFSIPIPATRTLAVNVANASEPTHDRSDAPFPKAINTQAALIDAIWYPQAP